jgi:cathepsin L
MTATRTPKKPNMPQAHSARDEKSAPAAIQARLKQQRADIAKHGWHYTVGFTGVSDKPLERITGLILPAGAFDSKQIEQQNNTASEVQKLEREAIAAFEKAAAKLGHPHLPEVQLRSQLPQPSTASFDWTKWGKVSPVRYQGTCGSCWDFASVSALESSILIRYNADIELSPQYVLDNTLFSSCQGGSPAEAMTVLMVLGSAKESDVPYTGNKSGPRAVFDNPYRALIWSFVGNGLAPTGAEMKLNLLLHGPLAVGMYASDQFVNYTGGIYDSFDVPTAAEIRKNLGPANHVVTLVGWDDEKLAWRIKNSWGTTWGENGFGWVKYGTNFIGTGAVWVEALNTKLQLPKELLELLEDAKKLSQELGKSERKAVEEARKKLAESEQEAERIAAQAAKAADQAKKQVKDLQKATKETANEMSKASDAAKDVGRAIAKDVPHLPKPGW